MPRETGSKNKSFYRYSVYCASSDCTNFFISQKEIEKYYDMKRTAIYFLLNKKDRLKDHKGLIMTKLEDKLPVYETRTINDDGCCVIIQKKIVY